MASVAVAAFVPAELCPDHLVAAGTLTQAELPARDLGHGRLLLAACPSPHAVTTPGRFSSLAELPGEVSGVGLVMLATPACGTGGLLPSPYRWHGVPSHPALSPIGDKPQTPFELGRRGNYHRMPAERGTLQFDADLRPAKVPHRDDHTWTVHEVLCEWKHPGTGTRTDGSARGGALLAAARVRPTADCPAPDAESRSPGGS
jgi:hypothetical protein